MIHQTPKGEERKKGLTIIEREIIQAPVEQQQPAPDKKKHFPIFWKIAAGIGGLIAFLAALVAIFDSQTARNFWAWFASLLK